MSPWAGVPVAAFCLVVAALGMQAYATWRHRNLERSVFWATAGAASLLWMAFFFLLSRFIVVDVSYEYVFQYTSTQVPLRYRIAGTWTGREGSLLLWTAYTATAAAIMSRPRVASLARKWTITFLLLILLAFLWAVVAQDTFAATSDFFLQGRPEGNGLNPTLRSPFILIHPPLMFLAYALTAVTASAMLAQAVVGGREASKLDLPWSRVNWLVYTVAIGLGGIWAYYTLGFGGYWGWDPVELANLLPWIALTVFLHAQIHHVKHGAYALILPFLGILPFIFTLFSAISTRSGLWFSVHAFTDPTSTFNPDAPGRFLAILDVEPIVAFYVGLLMATFLVGLALWGRRMAVSDQHLLRSSRIVAGLYGAAAAYAFIDPQSALGLSFQTAALLPGPMALGLIGILFAVAIVPALPGLTSKPPEAEPAVHRRRLTERNLLYASVLTLGLGLLLFTLFHFQTVNGWDRAFYDARFPWLITPVLVLLILLQGHAMMGNRGLAILVASSLAAAGAAWLAVPSQRGGAYLVVLSLAALAVGVERLRRAMTSPTESKAWRAGGFLLWFAALLDLVFWVNPPTNVGLGPVVWHPVWPAQLILGGLSLLAVLLAQRNLAGQSRRWAPFALVAVLGGFYVSPLLAGIAWILQRKITPKLASQTASRTRLGVVAMQGLHLAFALGIVGFGLSTYFTHQETTTLAAGETMDVGPYALTFNDAGYETNGPWAQEIRPQFSIERDGRARGTVDGLLYWEPQTGSHFPLPVTRRAWDGDLYVDVQKVCVDGVGTDCAGGDWIEAYKASLRISPGQSVGAVGVNVIHLPGLALVWTAWALASFFMALRIAAQQYGQSQPVAESLPSPMGSPG